VARYAGDFVAAQRALAEAYGFGSYEAALCSWIATVAVVEVGYVGEWEEYALELTTRDYLDELMVRSPGSRQALEQDLAIWDERFAAATVEEEKPHLPSLRGEPGWWQFRSPRKWQKPASEELARRARRRSS
jgi:hypothetical protein